VETLEGEKWSLERGRQERSVAGNEKVKVGKKLAFPATRHLILSHNSTAPRLGAAQLHHGGSRTKDKLVSSRPFHGKARRAMNL